MNQALELAHIATCESAQDQLRRMQNISLTTKNVWSTDWGVFQINDYYWGKVFDQAGVDFRHDEDDNILAGVLIYKDLGPAPWEASRKGCWAKQPVGWS